MSGLAIIEPSTLLGETVRDLVGSREKQWSRIELFTSDPEAIGAVTEVAGQAAIVQSLEDGEALEGFATALVCGADTDPRATDTLPAGCRIIYLDSAHRVDDIETRVAGIDTDEPSTSQRILSPQPAIIMLSHLLAPMTRQSRLTVTAHVLQPASARGKAGLDELFEQTRNILSMHQEDDRSVFGAQLAFNLLPWRSASPDATSSLESILGDELEARVHISQAGVFHCCSAAVHLMPDKELEIEEARDLLLESPMVEQTEEPELLGPVSAASSEKILIGDLESPTGRGYWLWCCADNLFLAADNGLKLAEL